jgi:hypothetical protein
MVERIRSDQRLAVTIPALIFGPLLMLGPVVGGVCLLVLARPSVITVLGALGLCCAGVFIAYHMTQNYQWVEFDGTRIRGKRFWTRRLVENTLADVRDIRVLGAVVRNPVTRAIDATFGSVRGWEIRFHHGPSIVLVRYDMKNAEQLVAAVEHALAQREA